MHCWSHPLATEKFGKDNKKPYQVRPYSIRGLRFRVQPGLGNFEVSRENS